MQRTTVIMSPATRDRLLDLKRQWRARSTEAVLLRLLDGEPAGAKALFEARKKLVTPVLRKHQIKNLVAFGSRARGDARPDSDLDLVGDLPPDADLFTLVRAREELAAAFGMKVDFVTRGGLRPRLAAEIKRDGVRLA